MKILIRPVSVEIAMRMAAISIGCFLTLVSCNPFAPGLDDSSSGNSSLLGNQRDVDGVFQIVKYAYTFRDTTVYGQLVGEDFTFSYPDYDQGGGQVTWGRDEEMRTTYGLFENVQRLDLVWNDPGSSSMNPDSTQATVRRSFNLTVTFDPSNTVYVNGYAFITLERRVAQDPWMIVRWNDESNF